jgi:hypothetical protein
MPTQRSSAAGRSITCSCIQSRGTAEETEAYFFHRRDSFGQEVVVRVSRGGSDIQICCLYHRIYHPIERMQKPLTAADGTRLMDALTAASFWSAKSTERFRPMLDGSDWTIRGRQGDGSQVIHRRSPDGPIRDLGELFIELAGSEEINEYLCRHW